MRKKILIIHPSIVVRKGLYSIIRNYFNVDVLQFASTRDLIGCEDLQANMAIVFMSAELHEKGQIYQALKQAGKIIPIAIKHQDRPLECNFRFDHELSLYTNTDEIQEMISSLFKQTETPGTKIEENDSELTQREKEVLQLVALGKTNKEIAESLFISFHTVISHRKNITEKLGIKTISGLTVYAIMNNLIDTSSIDIDKLI